MHWAVRMGVGVVGFLICFLSFRLIIIPADSTRFLPKYLSFSSANSTFRIAVFADLHYGENAWTDWGPRQDQNSDRVISSVLNMENPDFVVYLGDVITANNLAMPNASNYWEMAISPTRNKNIPWASLFGNHDDMAFEWPEEWFGNLGVPSIQCSSSQSATGILAASSWNNLFSEEFDEKLGAVIVKLHRKKAQYKSQMEKQSVP